MRQFSATYPVWFCDVWGVIHDGYAPFAAACDALTQHRADGGTVVLLTNSPRSNVGVAQQLAEIGVPRSTWDRIVTSGDVTRRLMTGYPKLYHIGPARDVSIFEGLAVERVDLHEASAIICTGLMNEHEETPETYRWLMATAKERGLPFICANPDKMVRKGKKLVPCAGALADLFAEMGGTVLMAGKPFRPIYDLAMREAAAARGSAPDRAAVLAIGDGIETDLRGAAQFGIAAVLITGGVNDDMQGLGEYALRNIPDLKLAGSFPALG